MKFKQIAIYFCLILPFYISSCSLEEKEIRIGVSQCSDDAWHKLLNQELLNEANLYPGVDVQILNGEADNEKQIEDIQILLDKKIDLLIVSPNEAEALTPIIERVYDEGIPVILVDRKIYSDKYTTFIGADNVEVGSIAGQYIVSRLRNKGKIAIIEGLEGATSAIERSHGLDSILSQYPEIEVVARTNGNWIGEDTKKSFPKVIEAHPDIDLVFAHNDYMAIAANDVADSIMPENNIIFCGVDALYGEGLGIESILAGKINASIIYETGGDITMQTAMNILNDKPVEKEIILPSSIVRNISNARIMQVQREHIDKMNSQIARLSDILSFNLKEVQVQRLMLIGAVVGLILIIGIAVLLAKLLFDREKANQTLKLQKQKLESLSEQLEAATNAKLAFFTNVSHDFRTPLTLISDPIIQLQKSNNLSDKERSVLSIANKNVQILLRLINQTLDFRKYEDGKLSLNVSSFDFKKEFSSWIEAFQSVAKRKRINFSSEVAEGDYLIIADRQKIERILYNLLSNAFKFTPEDGNVNIKVDLTGENFKTLRIVISDNGIGIGKEDLKHIFENFYQAGINVGGSGIGLALTNSFVKLHNGTISVSSELGQGTSFEVLLPTEQSILPMNQGLASDEGTDSFMKAARDGAVYDAVQTNLSIVNEPEEETSKPIVLIVEDNQDVRDYIKLQLSDTYSIVEAANGKDGINEAKAFVPDVVICDVMMPIMNGMDCCRSLKQELQTSHIPVLMLTAYGMDEQKIDAYNCGADGYLTKPFATDVLLARLANLIENRKRLHNFFKSTTVRSIVEQEDLEKFGNADKVFIVRLNDVILKRMGDPELSVEDIGSEIGLGRVQLYRKVKSITGQSPNELLRIARLKKSVELLNNTDMNISEVAYTVGFNSSSYFTKCYKDYFGEAPTQSLKRASKEGE